MKLLTFLPDKIRQAIYLLKEFNFFFSPAVQNDAHLVRYKSSTDIKRMGLKIGSLKFS